MAVKIKLDGLTKLASKLKSNRIQKGAAEVLIKAMKNDIGKGLSPVFREGRYKRYLNPKKYPGKLKGSRPVNLKLSGDMLKKLIFRTRSGQPFEFGWFGGGLQSIKAGAHNEGVAEKNIAKRKMLPTKKGERFNASIMRKLNNYYSKIIWDKIKKS